MVKITRVIEETEAKTGKPTRERETLVQEN